MTEVYDACAQTCELVLHSVAMAMGRDPAQMIAEHSHKDCNLELKHYGPIGSLPFSEKGEYSNNISMSTTDRDDAKLRVKAHSDMSSLTLLLQNDISGFEILNQDGRYIPADYVPGAVLINTGDCMQRWSRGKIQSTKHRVVLNSFNATQSRYSLVYFCMPNWDTAMEPWGSTEEVDARFGDLVPFQ